MDEQELLEFVDAMLKHLYEEGGIIRRESCSTCKILHAYIHFDVVPGQWPVPTPADLLQQIKDAQS